ncbi:hypothetical protein Tco_1244971 [Tanacetum coccineum]
MPLRMRTRSAGQPAAESLGGGTSVRVSRGRRGRRPREGNDEHVDELNGQGNDKGIGANGGVEGTNGNVRGANRGAPDFPTIIAQQLRNLLPAMLAQNVGNVLVNGNRVGCSYKEFLACSPKEYDGKEGVVVLTRWIKKMENIYEMQKLETVLWNHAMVRAGHATYTNRFHELARLVPHLVTLESRKIESVHCYMVTPKNMMIERDNGIFGALTDEAVRNGSIKKVEKRGNMGEPSKDMNGGDDNKRTRTGNAFATTVNPVGRENTGSWKTKDHYGRAFMLGAEEAHQDPKIVTGMNTEYKLREPGLAQNGSESGLLASYA